MANRKRPEQYKEIEPVPVKWVYDGNWVVENNQVWVCAPDLAKQLGYGKAGSQSLKDMFKGQKNEAYWSALREGRDLR